jgi:hypothetical protein
MLIKGVSIPSVQFVTFEGGLLSEGMFTVDGCNLFEFGEGRRDNFGLIEPILLEFAF